MTKKKGGEKKKMNLQKKVASVIATASLLLQLATPVLADTTIVISGNGSDTENKADVKLDQTTYVQQSNTANIENTVYADANTGKNDANRNTGGSVSIDTGEAKTDVAVSNTVNSNTAEVKCCEGDLDVLISGNGDSSKNKVELDVNQGKDTGTQVYQNNSAKIENTVDADANTGKNDADRNTGGSVSITTGKATTEVDVINQANANSALVGGNSDGAKLSLRILGNGADTENKNDLDYDRSVWVDQSNQARIENYVDADADTGKNDANRNTGGTVSIDTGNAKVDVAVDNMVNFNWADVDCGCILDVLAKIVDNGDSSKNEVKADIEDLLGVVQDNSCDKYGYGERSWWWKHHKKPCLDNEVYADADTGKNDVDRNTGDPGVDPSIETGNAETDVVVENSGNSNVFGETAPDWGWEPPFPGMSFNINLTFSLGDLLAALLG